jgi:hypothetical protein
LRERSLPSDPTPCAWRRPSRCQGACRLRTCRALRSWLRELRGGKRSVAGRLGAGEGGARAKGDRARKRRRESPGSYQMSPPVACLSDTAAIRVEPGFSGPRHASWEPRRSAKTRQGRTTRAASVMLRSIGFGAAYTHKDFRRLGSPVPGGSYVSEHGLGDRQRSARRRIGASAPLAMRHRSHLYAPFTLAGRSSRRGMDIDSVRHGGSW